MRTKRLLGALFLAGFLGGAFEIIGGGGIGWCDQEWVYNSSFWSWYFNCPSSAGGGDSGAGYVPLPQ